MKNKLIIFDFFGVICSEIAPFVFNKYLSKDEADIAKEDICGKGDQGELKKDEIYDAIAKRVNASREEIMAEWNSHVKINNELVSFIKELKIDYHIALLSNAPIGFVEGLLKKFKLEDLFEVKIISSAVKCAKPDERIYKICLNEFKCRFDKVYMIDDSPKNLVPCTRLGINPIRFTNLEELKGVLSKKN